jgi:subtilase family serine protease
VAIVDSFGYPQVAADLETFSQGYGLPLMCGMPGVACSAGMPTFSVLQFGNRQVKPSPASANANPYGPGQEASNNWALEVGLDTQWVHSIAPKANILLVVVPTAETLGVQGFPNMMNAEQYVVDHHLADVMTQSFGAAEDSFSSSSSLENLRHAFESGVDPVTGLGTHPFPVPCRRTTTLEYPCWSTARKISALLFAPGGAPCA